MINKTQTPDSSPLQPVEKKSTHTVQPVDFSTDSNVVIRVEDIWKQYRLGTINHGTLAHDLQSLWAQLRGKEDPNLRIDQYTPSSNSGSVYNWSIEDKFWALREISFDVREGDVLGIVGRNGAGKSTLLKILSKVTTPTRGQVKIRGRISSLLEVGTGFHPELTGRENVFLNGAILGMSQKEVRSKFDEIVEFAEIEKFIDTPVKRYSSGMYVRLAFAVAAHLEPDILVIDEVLAVGDTVFQKKCIDKISEINSQGRTVLLVSHNLSLINSLCKKGVLLQDGQVEFQGTAFETVDNYVDEGSLGGETIDLDTIERKSGKQDIVFEELKFLSYPVKFGDPIRFKVKLRSESKSSRYKEVDFGVAISDRERKRVVHCSNRFIGLNIEYVSDSDEYVFEIQNILKPGEYYLTLFLRTQEVIQDWLMEALKFEVEDGNPYGYYDTSQINGMILPEFNIYQEK